MQPIAGACPMEIIDPDRSPVKPAMTMLGGLLVRHVYL